MTTKRVNKRTVAADSRVEYAAGSAGFKVACMLDGQRIPGDVSTKTEAETRAAQIRVKIQNEGSAASSPTAHCASRRRVCALLKTHGATIRAARDTLAASDAHPIIL